MGRNSPDPERDERARRAADALAEKLRQEREAAQALIDAAEEAARREQNGK